MSMSSWDLEPCDTTNPRSPSKNFHAGGPPWSVPETPGPRVSKGVQKVAAWCKSSHPSVIHMSYLLTGLPFVGNHVDIQKTGLYCMQFIQEFFTRKIWLDALSGSLDLILKWRRRQREEWVCARLAKGGDQDAEANHPYFFLKDHIWGRISWFWSASSLDLSWLQLIMAPWASAMTLSQLIAKHW